MNKYRELEKYFLSVLYEDVEWYTEWGELDE
jgi:hypothetical protein